MAKIENVSPLAPSAFPELPEIDGVTFATVEAGVKYQARTDLMLARLAPGTSIAGVFTRSATRSAAVLDCQEKIGKSAVDSAAIVVNSGNANAFTGSGGAESVRRITEAVATEFEIPESRVFTASTGVIGELLPHDKIVAALPTLSAALSASKMQDAAKAIMTTDTFAKASTAQVMVGGKNVSIAGIAKGSGMIAPDMATMLVYIFTDAMVEQTKLQGLLSELTGPTFNSITVDSDTSTSDTLLLCATGASGVVCDEDAAFKQALHQVMLDLAHQVVRDGEGATKFVEINVTGAASEADARKHALSIANSPLVKTAIAGEDPNWGRIVMAVGKSGAAADRDKLSIWFGDILVAKEGWVYEKYREEDAAEHMKGSSISIRADIGIGNCDSTVWTCDLTHGYIEINADYRS
ncbi:bifunctional glutamate N-acetyltransferase/amino-acid acetyltransferase ArgJ [Lentibacter algarum]|uniref:bifunctional glutamate N-acetyltransferase/amino-acid acetyltransferase ArgJ n=1 Tax=Lentibacter algarum TaxID=576131 RepID=UPI001C07A890|nr:bifunctional glutamate N-acetyltransferase/amino-acid acetyltransferase ArgJ [Lentibacter algarum]MBU2981068.1 bifunctional glutamate N-acetyltransferase/amino-acid acetyltransferase ArgJ [Lentibacter algarum]